MVSNSPSGTSDGNTPNLPLFYRHPQPLSSSVHGEWRLQGGDAAFAADTPYVPIVAGELIAAARCYPIVFAAGDAQPVAVLGLQRRNLFVKDGRWEADGYVPAYVRRYPFGFIATGKPDEFVLAIDAGSERVVKAAEEGRPFFEDGKPSELTRQALAFCDAFQSDAKATRVFAEALKEQDLLIDQRVDATLPDGHKLGLEGFQIVDREKFAKLSEEVLPVWHRNGYLAWVQFHLASLDRFTDLLNRQSSIGTAEPRSSETPKHKSRKELA